jgi:hypothetical protein
VHLVISIPQPCFGPLFSPSSIPLSTSLCSFPFHPSFTSSLHSWGNRSLCLLAMPPFACFSFLLEAFDACPSSSPHLAPRPYPTVTNLSLSLSSILQIRLSLSQYDSRSAFACRTKLNDCHFRTFDALSSQGWIAPSSITHSYSDISLPLSFARWINRTNPGSPDQLDESSISPTDEARRS